MYQISLGKVGLYPTLNHMLTVEVETDDTGIRIPSTKSLGWFGFSSSWAAKYDEIKRVQFVKKPWRMMVWRGGRWVNPLGLRLNMGDSRLRVVLFGPDINGLADDLEGRGLQVERTPVRLMGRS